jgi:hypothetical protein
VPITHVPAWAESRRGAGPTARPVLSPHERMLDPPTDCTRLRMALSVLQVVRHARRGVRWGRDGVWRPPSPVVKGSSREWV